MLYKTFQVLKILNVSKPTLYKICKEKNINPKKTIGGHFRYSDIDVQKLLNKNIHENIEEKFVDTVNDVWLILKKLSEEIWGLDGEQKLIEILQKNKNDIFILNLSNFKEM